MTEIIDNRAHRVRTLKSIIRRLHESQGAPPEEVKAQLKALVRENQFAAGAGLIGKMVRGLDAANDSVTGLVTSVRMVEGRVVLELDTGRALPMDRVAEVAKLTA